MRVRGQTCSRQRCKRPARAAGLCKSHAEKEADRLFSLALRADIGVCQIDDGRPCKGALQCMHILSRSWRAIRWDRTNVMCGCAGHHLYYTLHPQHWTLWIIERFGLEYVFDLRERANTHVAPDLELVLAELKAAA